MSVFSLERTVAYFHASDTVEERRFNAALELYQDRGFSPVSRLPKALHSGRR
jgi:hypothetical protein